MNTPHNDPWATPTDESRRLMAGEKPTPVEWVAPRDRRDYPAALNARQKTGTEPIKPAGDAR